MKTFHRLMYENLTPDEWQEMLKVGNVWENMALFAIPDNDFTGIAPYKALSDLGFIWRLSPQGPQYWEMVCRRLYKFCK